MFVLIAGAGRTGAQLAKMLILQGYQVHLIDQRKEILARVHKELPTEVIFEGDPVDPNVSGSCRDPKSSGACSLYNK